MYPAYVGRISEAVREHIGSISGRYRHDIGSLSGAYRQYIGCSSGLYREYIGSILRLSRLYIRSISGKYWAHIGCALHREYIGRISESYWMHATMAGKRGDAAKRAPNEESNPSGSRPDPSSQYRPSRKKKQYSQTLPNHVIFHMLTNHHRHMHIGNIAGAYRWYIGSLLGISG